ncbi:MAG: murein hydrolase activator EnvC family protein [Rhizomicrobium sp.]
MRIQPTKERSLKRIAALALCVASAALLSGCETYQDARSDYADFYKGPVPGGHRQAHYEHRDNARRVADNDDVITPRARPTYTSAEPAAPSGQQTHLGDPMAAGFTAPVSGRIIEGFGAEGGGQRNDGINIAAAAGTPIHAAADGVVTYAGSELKSYGNLILIKHGGDYITAYAHADTIGVARGQRVSRGDVIGTVGDTGDVHQPQLHFEIRHDMKPIDPRPLLTASRD